MSQVTDKEWRAALREYLGLKGEPINPELQEDECQCPDCTLARAHGLRPWNPFILEVTRR